MVFILLILQEFFWKKSPGFEPSPLQTRKKQKENEKKNLCKLQELNSVPLDLQARAFPLNYQVISCESAYNYQCNQ